MKKQHLDLLICMRRLADNHGIVRIEQIRAALPERFNSPWEANLTYSTIRNLARHKAISSVKKGVYRITPPDELPAIPLPERNCKSAVAFDCEFARTWLSRRWGSA